MVHAETRQIRSLEALEACVGMTPGPRDLKVIDFLDHHALRWISASPCVFASLAPQAGLPARVLVAGGRPGFVGAAARSLAIPREAFDDCQSISTGDGWGSLFVIPALRESLRVNGRVSSVSAGSIHVEVTECYLHCAKAFMRSGLWEDFDETSGSLSEDEFLRATRFMLVATTDSRLQADLSPKGDPAGMLLRLSDGCAWYPDRPGNRRVDGFRNVLTQPGVEILALLAGSNRVLRIAGQAQLFSEHPQKRSFTVQGKVPSIVVRVAPSSVSMSTSEALARASLWPPKAPALEFKAADIWQAHLKLSKVTGVEAAVAKAATSVPGVLKKGLDWDYKNKLY